MRSYRAVLLLLTLQIACNPPSLMPSSAPLATQELGSTPGTIQASHLVGGVLLFDTQEVVSKMRALCCEAGWEDHLFDAEKKSYEAKRDSEEFDTGAAFLMSLEAAGGRFDVNEYFTVLTHLMQEDGYVLDYVYFAPGGDGAPYMYARREGEPAFANYSEYEKAGVEHYINYIRVDGTAESFYELAVLSIMGGQFYLSWHFEYNDWEVVSSRERLNAIIERLNDEYHPLTAEQVEAVLQLDVTPRVQFEGDIVQVRILAFTKWGGFYERIYTIERNFPHQMIGDDIQLIPYHCGIIY